MEQSLADAIKVDEGRVAAYAVADTTTSPSAFLHPGPVQRALFLRECFHHRAVGAAHPEVLDLLHYLTVQPPRGARAQHRRMLAAAARVGFCPRVALGHALAWRHRKTRVAAEYGLSLCRYCCSVLARRREGHWTSNPVRLLTARRRAYR